MKKIFLSLAVLLFLALLLISCASEDPSTDLDDPIVSTEDGSIISSVGLAYKVNSDGVSCTITGRGDYVDENMNIPNHLDGYAVTAVGDKAFYHDENLTSVTIPDSVTLIGDSAFSHCTRLMSIAIPDSVTSIGVTAFFYCTGLTSITIPDSVTSIGGSAFSHCTGLTSITIPDSVTSIGWHVFDGCKSLKSVYYGGTKSEWDKFSINLETVYYYYETRPTEKGNYWHYVNGVPTRW